MKLQVEVIDAEGSIKSGIGKKSGKPYVMADQTVHVFEPGSKYPVKMQAMVKVPTNDAGIQTGDPEWFKPGMYEALLLIAADRFGSPDIRIDFRNMRPIAAAVKKAA